jgi:hypothetical protein
LIRSGVDYRDLATFSTTLFIATGIPTSSFFFNQFSAPGLSVSLAADDPARLWRFP